MPPCFALVWTYFALCGAGVLVGLAAPGRGGAVTWLRSLASLALVLAGASALLAGRTFTEPLWTLPEFPVTLTLRVDALSAVFVLLTGLVLLPASIFAGGSVGRSREPSRAFHAFLSALYASIALIFLAGDVVLFLFAWELMSVLCWLLIVGAREGEEGRAGSGYLLLALGEAGTLAVAVALLLLAVATGSLGFGAVKLGASGLSGGARWAVFLLSFFGFGVKAGLVPVNNWLPRAYVAAPRAFVPVLAGATLNLGLYGIIRVNADLMPAVHLWPGLLVLIVGTASALLGILYATTDNDLKMMLAHSSIENVGIIVAGIGAGMVFVATAHAVAAAIAFVAALYQLVNHSLYKTLLFFGVGAVEAQTGTREMDRLGGLNRWMPLTAVGFLVGALSIAAMPPFNGFVSEWLTLQALLRSVELSSNGARLVFALCGAGLALTAALAVTCFVKAFGMCFLGKRRLDMGRAVREPRAGTLAPMAMLAVLCLALGVLPTYVIPALNTATEPLAGASAAAALVPPFFASSRAHHTLPAAFVHTFHDIGAQVGEHALPGRSLVVLHRGAAGHSVVFAMSTFYLAGVLLASLLLTYVAIRLWLTRSRKLTRHVQWDGGVRSLLPEMTYTATGFSNPVRVIFDAIFRPTMVEDTRETVASHFQTAIRRQRVTMHVVDRFVVRPARHATLRVASALAAMHHGRINAYAAYVLLAMLAALAIGLIR